MQIYLISSLEWYLYEKDKIKNNSYKIHTIYKQMLAMFSIQNFINIHKILTK